MKLKSIVDNVLKNYKSKNINEYDRDENYEPDLYQTNTYEVDDVTIIFKNFKYTQDYPIELKGYGKEMSYRDSPTEFEDSDNYEKLEYDLETKELYGYRGKYRMELGYDEHSREVTDFFESEYKITFEIANNTIYCVFGDLYFAYISYPDNKAEWHTYVRGSKYDPKYDVDTESISKEEALKVLNERGHNIFDKMIKMGNL